MAIFTCEVGGLVALLILEVTSCEEIPWRSSEGRSAQPVQLESDGTHLRLDLWTLRSVHVIRPKRSQCD